ncbi:MAG: GNAT family N-acetyltransferase [Dokdonella sp.]|uniref:GNAT family N-acetyltransferase n=1 Tax=Dokdonella sp. TaxID=2291710 RepID=UPI0032669CE2
MKHASATTRTTDASTATYRSATRPPVRFRPTPSITAHAPSNPVTVVARDGRVLELRAILPGDAPALRRAFDRMTPDQIRARFFYRMNELSEELADRLCHVDQTTTAAFVVTDPGNDVPGGEIRGEARMHVDPVTQTAEFALAVDPGFVEQGIGSTLLRRLLDECRRRGLLELWGDVLVDNHAMLDLARHLDPRNTVEHGTEPGLNRVRLAV